MKWLIFPSLLLMSFLISGCQSKSGGEAYDLTKDKSAPEYMSNHFTGSDTGRVIGNDVSNQNPNFLNLKGTRDGNASGASGNNGVDSNRAKQVVAATDEFTTDSVWINGDRMWVTVYKKGKLGEREKMDAEARLHKKLTEALPRYNIEVRVQEDRR